MADFIKITGNLPDGSPINLNIDGASTQRQMERLIKLVADMTDRLTKGKSDVAKQEKADKEHLDNTLDLNKAQTETLKTGKKTKQSAEEFNQALNDLRYGAMDLQGGFKSMMYGMGKTNALAAVMGSLTGSVMSMADTVGLGLQRGVSGGIMDFAIAAKTAGVDTATFSKALEESGGAFASLGQGASIGAKNFGALVGEVRHATASVGNLGLSNDQLAMFTAQQTKVAVAQGFKGKQAQDVIIRNSRELGNELDTLASRTGKSVLELAQSAMKLAQDPIVASFVKSAGMGGKYISQSIQSLGAEFKALFGEAGDQMAADLAKSVLGGLPFAVTQTGKNMILASSSVYNEMDRQAQIAKNGGKITEKDQEQLRNTIMEEVAARGDQLRMMANLDGPAGDSARQLLAMAVAAENYNSDENKRARKQDETAKAFNASVRDMQANLQALAIPFLNLINGVNWTFFIDVLNGFVKVIDILLTPLTLFGKLIGDTGVGTVVGGLLALVTAGTLLYAGFNTLTSSLKKLQLILGGFDSIKTKLGMEAPKPTTPAGGLANIDKRLEAQRLADEQRKARTAEFYKQFRDEGKSPIEAKRAADTATAFSPKANIGEKLAKAGPMVEKFAGAITGVTAALAGSALSIWGESRLREDENDWLGQVLVTGGKTLEFLGVFGGLLFQLYPVIASATTSMIAHIAANGGVIGSLVALGTSLKASSLALMEGVAVLGRSLITGLAPAWSAITLFATRASALAISSIGALGNTILGVVTTTFPVFTAAVTTWASTAIASITAFATQAAAVITAWASTALPSIAAFATQTAATMAAWASTALASVTAFAIESATVLAAWASTAMTSIGAFATRMLASSLALLPALGGLAVAAWTAAAPFLPLIAAVAALAGVAYLVYDSWDSIVEAGKNIIDFVLTPFQLLGDGIMAIWDWLKSSWLGKLMGMGGDSGDGKGKASPNNNSDKKSSDMKSSDMKSSDAKVVNNTQSRGNSGWNDMPPVAHVTDENGNKRRATLAEVNAAKDSQRAAGASTAYPTDQSTTTSNVLPETAAKANETNAAKESETQKQAQKQTALLEEVVASNNAQVNIQARGVSVQDSSNRYLRQTSMATQ